mmetsp:Transcript_29433/g.80481  ORF Transcript_29433/g.80481 Transcript_29433/m.80481 type:complete len:245 (+) Transcript_29433:738-1472(+)
MPQLPGLRLQGCHCRGGDADLMPVAAAHGDDATSGLMHLAPQARQVLRGTKVSECAALRGQYQGGAGDLSCQGLRLCAHGLRQTLRRQRAVPACRRRPRPLHLELLLLLPQLTNSSAAPFQRGLVRNSGLVILCRLTTERCYLGMGRRQAPAQLFHLARAHCKIPFDGRVPNLTSNCLRTNFDRCRRRLGREHRGWRRKGSTQIGVARQLRSRSRRRRRRRMLRRPTPIGTCPWAGGMVEVAAN